MRYALCPGLLAPLFAIAATSCAHSYYYLPEIAGEGATHGKKGGIIYGIPPTDHPLLTLRMRSLGVDKVKGEQLLGVRMSFVSPEATAAGKVSAKAFVDPTELLVRLAGGLEIKPKYIHAKNRKQSIVELGGQAPQAIELLYPLPAASDGAWAVSSYFFQWKVHYGTGKVEQQTVRFDRYDSRPQQGAELFPEDSDFPFDLSPMDMNGWHVERDPYWWSPYPGWLGW